MGRVKLFLSLAASLYPIFGCDDHQVLLEAHAWVDCEGFRVGTYSL